MKYSLFFLLVLIAGCTQSQNTSSVTNEPTASMSEMFSLCLAFSESDYRITCAAAFGSNVSVCDSLSGDSLIECRIYAAAVRGNMSACAGVTAYVPENCVTTVAMAVLDDSLCVNASSPSGCVFSVKSVRPFSVDDCKVRQDNYETICVLNYAWQNNDSSACNYLTGAFVPSCQAMLSGNNSICKGLGVSEWSYCNTKALYPKVMPQEGVFNPDLCSDNEDCEYFVLREMINYVGRQ